MGAVVRGRVEDTVDDKGRHAPDSAPGQERRDAGQDQKAQPGREMPKRLLVRSPHEGFERLAIHGRGEPCFLDPRIECAVPKIVCRSNGTDEFVSSGESVTHDFPLDELPRKRFRADPMAS